MLDDARASSATTASACSLGNSPSYLRHSVTVKLGRQQQASELGETSVICGASTTVYAGEQHVRSARLPFSLGLPAVAQGQWHCLVRLKSTPAADKTDNGSSAVNAS